MKTMKIPRIEMELTGQPLPLELTTLGIRGILFTDGIQVSADTTEKTLERTKAIALYLYTWNSPLRTVTWNHPDSKERVTTTIGEWARTWLNPEPSQEILETANQMQMTQEDRVNWIVDPFNLIRFTSTPQT
jgi:hypothetical protein